MSDKRSGSRDGDRPEKEKSGLRRIAEQQMKKDAKKAPAKPSGAEKHRREGHREDPEDVLVRRRRELEAAISRSRSPTPPAHTVQGNHPLSHGLGRVSGPPSRTGSVHGLAGHGIGHHVPGHHHLGGHPPLAGGAPPHRAGVLQSAAGAPPPHRASSLGGHSITGIGAHASLHGHASIRGSPGRGVPPSALHAADQSSNRLHSITPSVSGHHTVSRLSHNLGGTRAPPAGHTIFGHARQSSRGSGIGATGGIHEALGVAGLGHQLAAAKDRHRANSLSSLLASARTSQNASAAASSSAQGGYSSGTGSAAGRAASPGTASAMGPPHSGTARSIHLNYNFYLSVLENIFFKVMPFTYLYEFSYTFSIAHLFS